jgi:hypothetical protein
MTPFYLRLHDNCGEMLVAAASIDCISHAECWFKPNLTRLVVKGQCIYVLETYEEVFKHLQQGCREMQDSSIL